MNEEVDTVRDKKSASRRHVIHKAHAPRVDANLRRRSSLRKEIAFAQSVILPDANQQKAKQRTKERVKVIVEMVNELKNPTFQERIKIAAQTINPDERIRDLNAKSSYKRNVSDSYLNVVNIPEDELGKKYYFSVILTMAQKKWIK